MHLALANYRKIDLSDAVYIVKLDADVIYAHFGFCDGILNDGTKLEDAPFEDEIITLDKIIKLTNKVKKERWK